MDNRIDINGKTINERICKVITWKQNYLFKMVLDTLELELKKSQNIDDFYKNGGFKKVKKVLFDNGNSVIELVDLIVGQLSIVPSKSIIDLSNIDPKELENGKSI